ncbi:response regulator transcription factor [Maribacter sp. MJ134]|jgi:DNA-binding LytR/AlgR family response regulator|uniref:LytR/AlgR family response regulator transcription factor n=1 Tax=Maribacter sp. MJ134 TaxID=2496865 RepID=UPI000F847EE5|nr:LytTR family DNA-binding domain-containing protein [Maribacter sp. MJ134]AZQ59298.1 response regulator transcription factor [Maribacter sp. MJ134]
MNLKAIVVDDEPLAINVLKNYILQVKELELVATFSNAMDASSFLRDNDNDIDIMFLDINMPYLDGLEFLSTLHKKPFVIMTTAHEEHALKSFELEAIDYLVKPISLPRFLKSVDRIIGLKQGMVTSKSLRKKEKPSIFVKVDKKKLQKVYLDEIMVVESLKDYIRIITPTAKFIIHRTLSSFTDELPSDLFLRIHRSYTIAIDKVSVVEGNSVEVGGIRYTIGRSYLNDAKSRIIPNFNAG